MRPILACVISAVALTALAVPTDGLAKKGTIHACYAAKRPDKGAMRFVRGKKCHRGEKRLTWN
jgi:hypothetical protein